MYRNIFMNLKKKRNIVKGPLKSFLLLPIFFPKVSKIFKLRRKSTVLQASDELKLRVFLSITPGNTRNVYIYNSSIKTG